jgi:hypothetical protein
MGEGRLLMIYREPVASLSSCTVVAKQQHINRPALCDDLNL